ALIRRLAIEQLNLPDDPGIIELSRRSVPTAERQTIEIRKVDSDQVQYELSAA
ncbi:MAG: hypothetical protein RIR97_1212, partial [Pseudomonadota bacterium]